MTTRTYADNWRTTGLALALAAIGTFAFAQAPPAGSGVSAPPAAPPVAGPGAGSTGIAGPGAGVGVAGPGATAALPSSSGIATTPGDAVAPSAIGIATVPVNGIDAAAIGVATNDGTDIGVATDGAGDGSMPASPAVATVPSDADVAAADIGILGSLDATQARVGRTLEETSLGAFGLAEAAARDRFQSRVLIRGTAEQVEIIRRD